MNELLSFLASDAGPLLGSIVALALTAVAIADDTARRAGRTAAGAA